ncbi:MAG: HAD-IA family hydrolase [Lachnospiraceae bacterium]|nr:HAD-IA family hydrolase [Lachnospiraceae bacterium]
MRAETVIFDLDGTLLDTLEDLTDAVNHALAAFRLPRREIGEIRAFVGNGIRRLLIRAVPDGEENPDFEAVFEEFKRYYAAHCSDRTRPYEGVLELLRELSERGIKTAIVSNKADFAVQTLKRQYFPQISVAVGDSDAMKRKPAPDSVFFAMDKCGAKKDTTVYVGDSEVDIQTAKNAGITCISALWGFRDRERLLESGAEILLEKPLGLLELIENEAI